MVDNQNSVKTEEKVNANNAAQAPSMGSSFNSWESCNLGNSKMNDKFRRLMGIKSTGGSGVAPLKTQTPSNAFTTNSKQWFSDQEKHYEKARAVTHGQRGLGLGFAAEDKSELLKPNKHNKKISFDDVQDFKGSSFKNIKGYGFSQ